MKKLVAAAIVLLAASAAHAGPDVKGALAQILGKTPGQIGPAFTGVVIGATKAKGVPKGFEAHGDAFKKKYGVELHEITARYGDEVEGMYADLGGPGAERAVTAVWGPYTDKDDKVWVDAADHTCAQIAGDDSTVTFRRCQTIDDLIAPGRKDRFGFEPYPLLGTSLAALQKKMGAAIHQDDAVPEGGAHGERAWYVSVDGPPGTDGATVQAIVDGGDTIVRVQLASGVADDTAEQVSAAITRKLGVKPVDDGGDPTWKTGALRVRMHSIHGTERGVLYVSVTAAK